MRAPFKIVIPARYASQRFPGKVLVDINGKPMLQHVYERAVASAAEEVIIATDDARVAEVAAAFGAVVSMTSENHQSGTDRIAEVVDQRAWPNDTIIVNVQADEPLIPTENINHLAQNIISHQATMATLCVPLESSAMLEDPNTVTVVMDKNGYALYFSRAAIPFYRDSTSDRVHYRHIGLYAYRVDYLKKFTHLEAAPLEEIEKLEQLRVLWHGDSIHVGIAEFQPGPSIDTEEDLNALLKAL